MKRSVVLVFKNYTNECIFNCVKLVADQIYNVFAKQIISTNFADSLCAWTKFDKYMHKNQFQFVGLCVSSVFWQKAVSNKS